MRVADAKGRENIPMVVRNQDDGDVVCREQSKKIGTSNFIHDDVC